MASHESSVEGPPRGRYLLSLCLAALGVVFGDIGTSPLYALRECLHNLSGTAITPADVLGILSLILWSLLIVISVKYLGYVLRADNRGEGGILALMALASSSDGGDSPKRQRLIVLLGLFGAALLYGDGVITPAISVLSAVEGLKVVAPALERLVIPLTIAILVGLFSVQRQGTARVGKLFGPITLLWFLSLAALGFWHLLERPEVLQAVNPVFAVGFLAHNGWLGFVVLGSVFLVVTGGEALYADMGHLGARPIRLTWFVLVLPALLLNYFGQGALVLADPSAAKDPFFHMAPGWALYPMLVLATAATIIASQALISGVYSITRQAIMLGYSPRLKIEHTSAREIGQIYLPGINWILMLCTIGVVLGFGSSSRLAAAYGIAVTLTMVITTLLAFVVARRRWRWRLAVALAVTLLFIVPDLAFLAANLTKIHDGGWFPLIAGGAIFTLLTSWRRGREIVAARFREQLVPLSDFFELIKVELPARVPGMAVYMSSNLDVTPPALLYNLQHNRVVHQHVVLLTVITEELARVDPDSRVHVEQAAAGFWRIVARYGFTETPDVPTLLSQSGLPGYMAEHVTYFLGRERVLATKRAGMALWREKLFRLPVT